MQLERVKYRTDLKELFINSILKMYHYYPLNGFILNVFYFLGLLQPLLFTNFATTSIPTPINQFWYIEAIARPDLFLSEYEPLKFYAYLIPLFSCILLDILPLIANTMLKNAILDKFKGYLQIASYYQQLKPIYLQIPLNGLCFYSLHRNLNFDYQIGVELRYLNITLTIITLIWLFVVMFLEILLCKETLDLNLNCFLSLRVNFIDFLLWILNLFQFIIAIQFENFTEIIQIIIVFLDSILKLINVYGYGTCLYRVIQLNMIIIAYELLQSILLLINFQQENISQDIHILLYILVPPLSYMLIQMFNIRDFKILRSTSKPQIIKHLKYIFAKFLNDQFISYGQRMIVLTKIVSMYQQKKQMDVQQHFIQLGQDLIPKQVLNYYYKLQLKKYVRELQKTDLKNRNANHYIHYVSILFRLDLNNLALKQINILMATKKQQNHSRSQGTVSDKNAKSFNTIGQKSSQSKSSKSQEVQEEAQHQINKTSRLLALTGQYILTFYQKVRLNIIREKVREKLRLQFQYREITHDSFDLQKGVDLYVKSERRNRNLIESTLNVINSKLSFFNSLQSLKHIRSTQLFQVSKQLCQRIKILEHKINKLYNQFPSQRIQSLAAYFQGEVLDNYLSAQKIFCNQSIQDDKLINVHQNIKQTFFSKELVYMNIRYVEEFQELLISQITPQLCQFFRREYDDFKSNNSIEFLLPDAIKSEHSLLVQRFLNTSTSKFYLKKNLNFFRIYKNIIKPCEFFFDVNFSDIAQISFLAFFNESYQTSAFIMVDVNFELGGITKNLLDKLDFSEYYLENMKSSYLTNTPIEYIIPDFKKIINEKQVLSVTEFRFLKQDILFSAYAEDSYAKNKNNFNEWQSDNLIYFQGLLQINANDIFGYQYYVIEIKELKSDFSYNPNDNETYINSLDMAFSQVSDQEAIPNSPCIMNIEKEKLQMEIRNLQLFEIDLDKDKFYAPDMKFEINLLSPADVSINQLVPNSANPLLKSRQQEFFSQIGQNLDQSLQYSQQLVNPSDQAKIKLKAKEGTNSSKFAGMKQSSYYKKYEMLQRIIQTHNPKQLRLFIIFLVFSFIVGSIHFILVITKNYDELQQFISEIDMIELHSGFMAPHDIFIAMRIAIVTYNQYVYDGIITSARASQLTATFYNNIEIGYNEIKIAFNQQLSNPNLQPFFENRTIDMVFMKSNSTEVYNATLNIREGFQQTVQNLYWYKVWYVARKSTAGSAIQVFAIANQFYLHFWLEELTMEIFNYSKNRSYSINDSWTASWIIFVGTTLVLTSIQIYFYRIYYRKFDKYLNIFKFCSQEKLQHEIDRYKQMQKQLIQNSDQIFQYKFDIQTKETQLTIQSKIFEDLSKRNAKESQKIKYYEPLSSMISVSLIFGIWVIFFGLSVVIFLNERSYLDKYSGTADIYKLIQDMTYSSATLYQNRDFSYITKNFTYFTPKNRDELFQLLYLGIENIEKFNALCNSFVQSDFQVSDEFVTFFTQIQKTSVCDILGESVMGFLTPFCNVSIQGNYLKGLLPALNYMKDDIKTAIAVNNFTKLVDHPIYDNEGGIIMVRVFQLMTSKLKTSMVTVARNLQTVSIVLSTIYIVFSCFSLLILLGCVKNYFQSEYNIVRRFVQLLPTSITLLDDQFERHIRVLLAEETS